MLCKRCMDVMDSGTRYEKRKGQESTTYRRFFDCRKCHDRVYTNAPNFQEVMNRERNKRRNK